MYRLKQITDVKAQVGVALQDKHFPSNAVSLGAVAAGKEVKWLTVEEIFSLKNGGAEPSEQVALFSGTNDISTANIENGCLNQSLPQPMSAEYSQVSYPFLRSGMNESGELLDAFTVFGRV